MSILRMMAMVVAQFSFEGVEEVLQFVLGLVSLEKLQRDLVLVGRN